VLTSAALALGALVLSEWLAGKMARRVGR
jgi:hypothetical protein